MNAAPPRAEPRPMDLAVEAVRRGASYRQAAEEYGVSDSGVRRACKKAGVRSAHVVKGRGAKPAAQAREKRGERVVLATRRWLNGETQDAIAKSMGLHPTTVADYISDGMRERAESRAMDLSAMRIELLERHLALVAAFGREAAAALNEGERADAARCAAVSQRSLDSIAKMVGADAPQQVQVEHTGGPNIMDVLREAAAKAERVLAVPNGATMGREEGSDS